MKEWLFLPINFIIQQAFRLDPSAIEKLATWQTKTVGVTIKNTNWHFYFLFDTNTIRITGVAPSVIHAQVHAEREILWQFLTCAHKDDKKMAQLIEIEGDIETVLGLKNCLSALNIDWEGHLANLIGDVAAHAFFARTRQVRSWLKQRREEFSLDSQAYLRDELAALVTRFEVETFVASVSIFRQDVERASLRIKRLQSRCQLHKANS